MKLRIIIILLALFTFLSVSIGGYSYYLTLRRSVVKDAHVKAEKLVVNISNRIDMRLNYFRGAVQALAGLSSVRQALGNGDATALRKANMLLDNFNASMNADVCYIMDTDGTTIASSNRNSPTSFVGKNYSFRPYFIEAMNESPSVYMALGVTSNKRGIYFSHPVYADDNGPPSGVAVIKTSILDLEAEFKTGSREVIFLIGPESIIFISSRKELLFDSLWELSPEEKEMVAESKQFGKGPWKWTGFRKGEDSYVYDSAGNQYDLYTHAIKGYDGWKVILLQDHHHISDTSLLDLQRSFGYLFFFLLLLTGGFSATLYFIADNEIKKRSLFERELRKLNEELEQLTYVTSHDLRSPLVNVEGYHKEICYSLEELRDILKEIDMPEDMKERIASIIDKDIPEAVGYIGTSVRKMDSLLSGLLNLSRSGKVKLDMKELDMNELVSDVVSTFEHRFKAYGARYEISELSSCIGDENQLNQVFTNLIGNALKYHDPSRPGIIRIYSKKENGMLIYCVEDNGIGISPEEQEKIFNLFHQVEPARQGEGLGLNIVMKIVERHGGRVWVESEPGKGSRFFVALPGKR
jgi:C4-dicarboxylate-specific signal transduction histidine kinase